MVYTQDPELTYDHTNSIREDVTKRVAIMSPVTAPLTYQLPFGDPATQTDFDWLMDYIPGPVTDVSGTESGSFGGNSAKRSAWPSGFEAVFAQPHTRQRADNTTVICAGTVDVSASLRAALQYGVGDEYGYKIDMRFLEVVEQFDYNLHFGQYEPGNADWTQSQSARMTHGVIPWIHDTGYPDSIGTNSPTGTVTIGNFAINRSPPHLRTGFSGTWWSNDTNAALTRSLFHQNLLEPAYKRGMQIDGAVAFCGAAQKRIISDFALVYSGSAPNTPQFNLNERNVDARDRYINEGIDVFDTNLGSVIFNLDRHLDGAETHALSSSESGEDTTLDVDDCFFILDLRFWSIRPYRGIGYTPLAKTGDADKAMIVLEAGLEATNPIGGICMNDVSGS